MAPSFFMGNLWVGFEEGIVDKCFAFSSKGIDIAGVCVRIIEVWVRVMEV